MSTAVAPGGTPARGLLQGVDEGSLPDRRRRALATVTLLGAGLFAVVLAGTLLQGRSDAVDLASRLQAPSLDHPFGTDWLGRDVMSRTLVGLRLSLAVGTFAAVASALLALALAAATSLGRWADAAVGWLVDLVMAMPHLVLLILLAFVMGGGLKAVIIAVAVTHWPSLTRVLRGEARRVAASDYVAVAGRLGRNGRWIARRHLVPHLLPQFTVGLILLFPHAILHEASLSFLGLGLPPHEPAIGILLSEGMRYLSTGSWWLAMLPRGLFVGGRRSHRRPGKPATAAAGPEERPRMSLLEVHDLGVKFLQYEAGLRRRRLEVISGLDLQADAGEVVAVVGSSGSGKSLLAHAVLGILPSNARQSGRILYRGEPLNRARLASLRGGEIALVPQTVAALDPVVRVGSQVKRAAQLAGAADPSSSARSAMQRLELPDRVALLYPHELSGGMARRVLTATATVGRPALVLADEPTPGLQPEVVKETLKGLRSMADDGTGVVLITHDLIGALEVADKVAVFYAGTTVEIAPATRFAGDGRLLRHPYSRALWEALPANGFKVLPGAQPAPTDLPCGCLFADRCPEREAQCELARPPAVSVDDSLVRCLHA